MTKPMPSQDELRVAALWLEAYEAFNAHDVDGRACQRVREWLLQQADAADLRKACREAGVTVAAARRAMRHADRRR